jgi:spermidine/putrescine transport system permease protein
VVLPLTAPGIRAGVILVFIPCVGAYLTPDLLGGGKTVMIGNLVQNQFTTARDWPFGSAVSLALMGVVTLLVFLFLRRDTEAL